MAAESISTISSYVQDPELVSLMAQTLALNSDSSSESSGQASSTSGETSSTTPTIQVGLIATQAPTLTPAESTESKDYNQRVVNYMMLIIMASIQLASNDGKIAQMQSNVGNSMVQGAITQANYIKEEIVKQQKAAKRGGFFRKLGMCLASCALLILAVATMNPALGVMGAYMLAMNASSGQDKLSGALSKLPLGARIGVEIGIAIVMGLAMGGVAYATSGTAEAALPAAGAAGAGDAAGGGAAVAAGEIEMGVIEEAGANAGAAGADAAVAAPEVVPGEVIMGNLDEVGANAGADAAEQGAAQGVNGQLEAEQQIVQEMQEANAELEVVEEAGNGQANGGAQGAKTASPGKVFVGGAMQGSAMTSFWTDVTTAVIEGLKKAGAHISKSDEDLAAEIVGTIMMMAMAIGGGAMMSGEGGSGIADKLTGSLKSSLGEGGFTKMLFVLKGFSSGLGMASSAMGITAGEAQVEQSKYISALGFSEAAQILFGNALTMNNAQISQDQSAEAQVNDAFQAMNSRWIDYVEQYTMAARLMGQQA